MTTPRRWRAFAAMGWLALVGGCAQLRAANATPPYPMDGQLTMTLQQAEREALASRYGVVDRMLADFAQSHPNTPEAVETGFWRALFKLDPANQTASPRDAALLLDEYLGSAGPIAHRAAASSLRRVAITLGRPAPVVAAAPGAAPASGARTEPKADDKPRDDKARDDEVQRLKDELAKANAELERIKRRLAQPNP